MEVSSGEIVRRLEAVERGYVLSAVYTRDIAEIKADLDDIKDSNRWTTRLIITQFVAAFAGIVIWLTTQAS